MTRTTNANFLNDCRWQAPRASGYIERTAGMLIRDVYWWLNFLATRILYAGAVAVLVYGYAARKERRHG